MSLNIEFLNNLLKFMVLQSALFTFGLITSALMCIRNQHADTCNASDSIIQIDMLFDLFIKGRGSRESCFPSCGGIDFTNADWRL